MYWFAQAMLWGWLPLVLLLFLVMEVRRAVVISLIASWLFLPQLGYAIPLAPNYTKMSATCYAIIIGALLLDPKSRILHFKPLWIDLPVLIFCFVPMISSINNGLGPYDGASASLERIIEWGLPYLIGRLYFQNPEQAKDFALGIVIGGLVYVPLCLYEVRMSPQLHNIVYGFTPYTDWKMAIRWGGYRPTVFMRHGLAVALWMVAAATMAFWLWNTKSVKRIGVIPMMATVGALMVTSVLCKSTGALGLMAVTIGALLAIRYFNTRALMSGLVAGVAVYIVVRSTGLFTGEGMVAWLKATFPVMNPRTESLEFRLDHENAIVGRVLNQPIFGYGGWGGAFEVYLPKYVSMAVPDSLWIRIFGENGYVGLAALYAIFLAPLVLLLRKLKAREWGDPKLAPLVGLACVSLIYAMDGMFNTMINPVFLVAIGAVSGMAGTLSRQRVRRSGPAAMPRAAREPVARPEPAELPEAGDADDVLIDLPGGAAPLAMLDPPRGEGA
jgi:hypothetical protein